MVLVSEYVCAYSYVNVCRRALGQRVLLSLEACGGLFHDIDSFADHKLLSAQVYT